MRSFDPTAIDRAADPCEDFYQFACGAWAENRPRPADEGVWFRVWNEYTRDVDRYVRDLIEFAADGGILGSSDQQNVGSFYRACMDEATIEAQGLAPLRPRLERVDQMQSIRHFAATLAATTRRMGRYSKQPLLYLYVWGHPIKGASETQLNVSAGQLLLPDRSYYLGTGSNAVEVRAKYLKIVERALIQLGYQPTQSRALAKEIWRMESHLAKAQTPASERRNDGASRSEQVSLSDLVTQYPNIKWRQLFADLQAPATISSVNLTDVNAVRALNELLTERQLPAIRAYLKLYAAFDAAYALPSELKQAHFELFEALASGQQQPKPRWQTCAEAVQYVLPEPLSRLFIEHTKAAGKIDQAEHVWTEIKTVMRERLQRAGWINDSTRNAALAKLASIRSAFVAPENWHDDRSLRIDSTRLLASAEAFESTRRAREFEHIGEPLDIDAGLANSVWVVAYQSNLLNAIFITASQMNFLDPQDNDSASRYGGLGAFLAHELSHGYDTLGSQYDGTGRLRNWWTEADQQHFTARTQCIIDEVSLEHYPSGDRVDGDFVVSEQGAEIIGADLAFEAFKRYGVSETSHGLSGEQRFFTTLAQTLCVQASDAGWRQISSSDSHYQGAGGVNHLLRNTPSFAAAFACPNDSAMVKRTDRICRIW